jgi:hypothetical protein
VSSRLIIPNRIGNDFVLLYGGKCNQYQRRCSSCGIRWTTVRSEPAGERSACKSHNLTHLASIIVFSLTTSSAYMRRPA